LGGPQQKGGMKVAFKVIADIEIFSGCQAIA
jgi:hypothetical protein